jgi:glycosyltransferase involved in cell wall biosynthesis
MTKIRILLILPWLRTGGSERYVANLCRYMDKDRFETLVLYRGDWGPIGDEMVSSGTRPIHNPMKVYRPDQLIRFYALLRREKVHIVHSLNYRPNFSDAMMTKIARTKFVSSRRNQRFWKGSERLHLGERWRNSMTDLVIANAEGLRQSTIQFENLPQEKVLTIYNGVPMDQAERALKSDRWEEVRTELDIPLAAVVIGNMANLRPTKGQTYLLKAFKLVLERTAEPVYLVITGQGPEMENLRREIAELGIGERVRIHRTERDRFDVIRSYDIFVLSSLQEGFSNALVESMAMGRACVATDVGGNAEAIVHGISGSIVPPEDVEALAKALAEFVNDPERRRIVGQTAAVRARHEFNMERMVEEHHHAYQLLVNNKMN